MPTTQASQVAPASPSLLSIEQLADWLGVTDRFIRRLVAERRIPFLRIGRFIRLGPAEIEPLLDSQSAAAGLIYSACEATSTSVCCRDGRRCGRFVEPTGERMRGRGGRPAPPEWNRHTRPVSSAQSCASSVPP